MYSESVIFFRRASARILRASSEETLKVIVGIVLRYYHARFLQVNFSKEASLSEAIVPPTEWISTASTNDNMVQHRYIHRGCCFSELSCELDVRCAWGWISRRMVV